MAVLQLRDCERTHSPPHARADAGASRRRHRAQLGAVLVAVGKGNFDVFMACIKYIFLIVLVHNLLALGIGYGTSTMLRLPYKDRRTVTIETGIQNSGLGLILLLNPNIFPEVGAWANNGGMLVITAWWGVWHIVSGLTLAYTWKIRGRKEAAEE